QHGDATTIFPEELLLVGLNRSCRLEIRRRVFVSLAPFSWRQIGPAQTTRDPHECWNPPNVSRQPRTRWIPSSVRPLLRLEAIEVGRGTRSVTASRELRRVAEEVRGAKKPVARPPQRDGEFASLLVMAFSHCPEQHNLP